LHDADRTMTTHDHVVFIVDDDEDLREALRDLLESHGMRAMAFASAGAYMSALKPNLPACLVLDVSLPDINGLDLQRQIAERDHPPIVFITGHGDIAMTVKAMKAGAVDFLAKPFRDQDMLDAVSSALARDAERLASEQSIAVLCTAYDSLTSREREVMEFVVAGLLNKQIASELNLSEITVKIHRGQVMRKMGARSVADLVRKAEALRTKPPPAPGITDGSKQR